MLYLAHCGAHFPLQAPQDEIASWKGKFKKGWDKLREERYQRQLDMNLLGKQYPLTPRSPLIPKWSSLTPTQQDQSDHIMAIYAAVIEHIDKSVGDLVAGLKQKAVFDNTVIILLSDNGGNAEGGVLGAYKGTLPGDSLSSIMIGQAWAEVANTPFFLYKHQTHEGGISTPCIVSYPKGIPAQLNGTSTYEPAHVIDIMPTLLALSGSNYPICYNNNPILPLEGVNLFPAIVGGKLNRPNPIYWEHENNYALREGKWKLVKEKAETNWQLYDMDKNRTETNDVSACFPDITAQMILKLTGIKDRVGSKELAFPSNSWMMPVNKY